MKVPTMLKATQLTLMQSLQIAGGWERGGGGAEEGHGDTRNGNIQKHTKMFKSVIKLATLNIECSKVVQRCSKTEDFDDNISVGIESIHQ